MMRIAGMDFAVRMVRRRMYNDDGTGCLAKVDWTSDLILVSESVPSHLRAAAGAVAVAWESLKEPAVITAA
jgi:hypothetical protein